MNKKKIRVAILFGGKSAEHEVSLQSAKSIIDAIDKDKYELILIGIDKTGKWLLHDQSQYLLHAENPKLISLNKSTKDIAVLPGTDMQFIPAFTAKHQGVSSLREGHTQIGEGGNKSIAGQSVNEIGSIDVVFPVLHGPYGEDGSIQGLLKIMDIPFVGADVLGSAVGMDKDVLKRLLRDANIPITKFITLRKNDKYSYSDIARELGVPFFVKPANLGSSVGVSKVADEKEFKSAVSKAFKYDRKILIEEYIRGRELECSVLGNEYPIASVPGEVMPKHDFYTYEAKYIDENGAELQIPAELTKDIVKQIQDMAIKTYKVLCCEGMARFDCFLTKENKVIVNEINTIPGFTKISMYPKLWEASGISYKVLIDRLIALAIDRFKRNKTLKTAL